MVTCEWCGKETKKFHKSEGQKAWRKNKSRSYTIICPGCKMIQESLSKWREEFGDER